MKYLRFFFLFMLGVAVLSWILYSVMYSDVPRDGSLDSRLLSLRLHIATLHVLGFYIAWRVSRD